MKREETEMRERARIMKYEPSEEGRKLTDSRTPQVRWTADMRIEKYSTQESYEKGIPDEVQTVKGNTATIKGLFTLWNLGMGMDDSSTVTYQGTTYQGVYPLSHANTFIGVGDSSTPASASQTGLLGSAVWVQCDEGYPKTDADNPNTLQVKATFSPGVADQSWNEWGIANGDFSDIQSPRTQDNVVLFNRRVENMGVKSSQATWVIITDLTIAPTA